jgi:hypothetical protein
MKRREFIVGLGSAVGCPLAAWAQQAATSVSLSLSTPALLICCWWDERKTWT